jgi:hypothetical protein
VKRCLARLRVEPRRGVYDDLALARYRRFWEHYLCYVVRGKVMEFEFEVIK